MVNPKQKGELLFNLIFTPWCFSIKVGSMRTPILFVSFFLAVAAVIAFLKGVVPIVVPIIAGVLGILAFKDGLQSKHSILRNFPVLGRLRYFFEMIRPEIHQYFIESNSDGVPFSRELRSIVYQRAKKQMDSLPFGTQKDVYAPGYEWLNHSIAPKHVDKHLRFKIGGENCLQPYDCSLINIGAMSYGSLSRTAISALNEGAKLGQFAHNTGEGGVSPYHLDPGGDLIWQIGTGYFGCRAADGGFDLERYKKTVDSPHIKMVELKLSQGAKPGHGGILPGKKVSPEIAKIRGVEVGKSVLSPPYHQAFQTPLELCHFIQTLRENCGGRPVGIKLCIGRRHEFICLAKAMIATKIYPDYICVDGGEGGTGAAPLEFSNHLGFPLIDGLSFVHSVLRGYNLRSKIKIIASGRAVTGFQVIKFLALGADGVYMSRAMMLALGCIQALKCNANDCPTGVATQDPKFYKGLVVKDKKLRVAQFHGETMDSVCHMLGAMGVDHPDQLVPHMIMRRYDHSTVHTYEHLFPTVAINSFIDDPASIPQEISRMIQLTTAKDFNVHYEKTR